MGPGAMGVAPDGSYMYSGCVRLGREYVLWALWLPVHTRVGMCGGV